MATRAQNLDTAIDNLAAKIAEATANPKPNYSLDGESYSWESWLAMLMNQMEVLEKARQRADGPFEVRSFGA